MVSYSGLRNLTFFVSCFLFWRFVTFISDNNDINAEKPGVSMHCTNGIMVQICAKREAMPINKRDRDVTREISFSCFPNTVACHVSKNQVDQSHQAQTDQEESIKSSLSNSQYIEFMCVLCSYVATVKILNWTGFKYLIHENGESMDIQKIIVYLMFI